MKRKYFLFQSYFAYSLVCGLFLTLGNLKAQTLSSETSADSASCETEISAHNAKIFITAGTQVLNKELITNTEFVDIPAQIAKKSVKATSSDKTDEREVTEKMTISKKKISEKKYPSVKSKNFFKIPIRDSDTFFAYKEIYKSISLPQNNQFNGKSVITNNLDFRVINVSVDSVGFTFTVDIPNKLFSEASSIRPPPEFI